jgi:hypothetical protein
MRRTFCAQKVIWNFKDPDSIEYQNGVDVAMMPLLLGRKACLTLSLPGVLKPQSNKLLRIAYRMLLQIIPNVLEASLLETSSLFTGLFDD